MTIRAESPIRRVLVFALIFTSPYLFLVFMTAVTTAWPPPPPSDDAMIALLTERRPAFEALVRRGRGEDVGEGGTYAEQMRRLSAATGGFVISRVETGWFELKDSWAIQGRIEKRYVYYFAPIQPPTPVIDLHGDDAADVARALLCDPDRRADLRSLCTSEPHVNDLDVLRRYSTFDATWEAERPIDEHWSLRITHLKP